MALEQKLEEKSTANILLCLSVKHDTNDKFEDYDVDDIDSIDVMKPKISKGNIIDQLRYQVRAEAAHVFRDKYELLSNKIHALTDEAMSKSNCNSTASSKVSNSFPFNEEQVLQIIKSEKECPESCDNADVLSGITCMDQNLISNNQEDQFSNKTELNSATDPKLVEEHTFEVIK